MDVEATGWDKAVRFFGEFSKSPIKRYGTYLEKIADEIIPEAQSNLQNNQSINTGELLSSLRILENVEGKSILVGTDLPYAIFIEYGRGPVTSKGKVLHWKDKQTGKDVFAMKVSSTEPRPFLEPAGISILSKAPQIIAELENRFARELLS